jgi:hypothetical protein
MRRGGLALFVVYLVLALYLINNALNFISLPEFFVKIDSWILFLGGLFLIIGGINSLRMRRYRGY